MKKKEGELTIRKEEKLRNKLLGKKNQSIYFALAIIGLTFSLNIIIKSLINSFDQYLGFRMFEIFYICILSNIILKVKIKRHQKVAIFIMICPVLIMGIIGFCLPLNKKKCENKDECSDLDNRNVFEYIKIKYGVIVIPLLILFNELNNILRDYSWVKAKYLMDIRSLAPFVILFSIGLIGITLDIIAIAIFTNVPCNVFSNITISDFGDYINIDTGLKIDLSSQFCKIIDYDKNSKKLYFYFDNFWLWIKKYDKSKESRLEEFLGIPSYFIICFFLMFSHITITRYIDPNNILISKNIFYFIDRIICIILNKADQEYITYAQFSILELQDLLSIISNMICIEIIELRFCKLDYELKRNIKDRGDDDYVGKSDTLVSNRDTRVSSTCKKDYELQNFEKNV